MNFETQDYIDLLVNQVNQLKRCADLLSHVRASDNVKRTVALKVRAMARILDCDARMLAVNAIEDPELEVIAHLEQSYEVINQFEALECLVVAPNDNSRSTMHDYR